MRSSMAPLLVVPLQRNEPYMKGILVFHSETGTEGGHWAFQDERFMGIPEPDKYSCTRCGTYWDKAQTAEEPKPRFAYWIDRDSRPNPKRFLGGYMSFAEPQDGPTLIDPATGDEWPVSEGPGEFDQRWTHIRNETSRQCYDQGHEGWKLIHPQGSWSYEGLHVLNNGDELTVFAKDDPTRVVWSGTIDLHQHDLFTEDAGGLWIHADQIGMDRDTWSQMFFDELPAELSPA